MGAVRIPLAAYYGPQTQRAVDNFPIGSVTFPRAAIRALVLIKRCAAGVNQQLGILKSDLAEAIEQAAGEILDGALDDQFVVSVSKPGRGLPQT